jgi:acyl dehydratase
MATTVNGIAGLKDVVGQHLGYSEAVHVTQEQVNLFADATGDHQWIHTDPERAKDGPFGGPIAHGYLTLSLGPALLPSVLVADGFSLVVNYGLGKVRFPSPVPVGSKVVMGVELIAVDELPGAAQTTFTATFQVEGADKPSCVAEVIYRFYE